MSLEDQVELEALKEERDKALRLADKYRKRQAAMAEAAYQAVSDAMQDLRLPPVKPPKKDARKRASEVAVAVLSDWQLAKTTPSYDTAVCERRVKEYAEKVKELTNIQRADHPVSELRVYLLGDLVEGELIFPGQAHRIDSSLYRQVVVDGPRILGSFLRDMLAEFASVRVEGCIGNHGCGQESMRAVTPEGLKRWDELFEGDLVMSADDSGNRTWEPVQEVVAFHHSGPMVRLRNARGPNLGLTMDHRVVGRDSKTKRWVERRADNLRAMEVLSAAKNSEPDADISDVSIRLAAWCFTDSHRNKRGEWSFYQRASAAPRLDKLLLEAGIQHRRYTRERVSPFGGESEPSVEWHLRRQESDMLSAIVPHRDRLPAWCWELSENQVRVLLQEWVDTDGTLPNGASWAIYCSKTRLREDLMRLCAMNGLRASASEYRPGHWRLNISDTMVTNINPKKNVSTENYDGVVWCVRVPSGRFFVEDNGRICLTGNSIGGRSRRDMHPETNADAMMYEVVKGMFADEKRLTWGPNMDSGERKWYFLDRIGTKKFFGFHGDQIKGGFAGWPWYGFGKKLLGWRDKFGFDYSLSGHFHTPVRFLAGGGTHWGNGSTESDNTYALEMLAAQGNPSQWLLFTHPKKGITAEYEVHLD